MKTFIVCALALLALAYGQDEAHEKSHVKANSHYGNPYKHLLRTRKDGHICASGSKVEGACQRCFCTEKGTAIICVNNGLCPHLLRYRRDVPTTESTDTHTDRSCIMCTCEPNRICTMREYEICPLQGLDPPNVELFLKKNSAD